MNLSQLFETQAALDARIYESHPELKGQDNLDWKVLALQVELGECANEWRGFKKWSHDREPRVRKNCSFCNGLGVIRFVDYSKKCRGCNGSGSEKNPLLEEYVDCLHFILSIGLELKKPLPLPQGIMQSLHFTPYNESITTLFIEVNSYLLNLYGDRTIIRYARTLQSLLALGATLGFTWDEVEEAYYAKNQVNHQRQEANY